MSKPLKRILIAEDDQFISRIMRFNLEGAGYFVDYVSNGLQAIERITSGEYALVMLDLVMPGADGFEVLRKINDMKNKPPVLVFSNLSQEEDKKEVLSMGVKEYFVKSDVSINEVVAAAKKYLAE